MNIEEIKDELYRLLSDCVNGHYPIRNNTQRGRYKHAVFEAIKYLDAWEKVKEEIENIIEIEIYEDQKWTSGLKYSLKIINKHLKEVEK